MQHSQVNFWNAIMSCLDTLQCDTWLSHCQVKGPKCPRATYYAMRNCLHWHSNASEVLFRPGPSYASLKKSIVVRNQERCSYVCYDNTYKYKEKIVILQSIGIIFIKKK